jgi:hypothetical protein
MDASVLTVAVVADMLLVSFELEEEADDAVTEVYAECACDEDEEEADTPRMLPLSSNDGGEDEVAAGVAGN